ncbi:B-cell receptor CD22-like [Embiotoca jacksoni]|uniref:B-cell receptor CD22-like n=1 Tax=Embiotoca jacksoni TaxID=100190 RepID=UPI0037039518
MLLTLAAALCQAWKVEYQQRLICAVKGSSVVIGCSFDHPDKKRAERVLWGHIKPHEIKPRVISYSNVGNVSGRFQYIGDKRHNCSLKIHQVEHNLSGKYVVRINPNTKAILFPRVVLTLQVVDLNISVIKPDGNETLKEGDSVNLTCVNSCDHDNLSSAFTWFKNGEPVDEGLVLYLRNMSSTNSGNYTCSLKTHTGATSRVVHIDVEYGPKNTSVEVDAGSNLTLICRSHANPPVENYTWFKIAAGDITKVGHQPVLLPGDAGRYLCSATNKHASQNSSVVTLHSKEYWATFPREIIIIAAVAVILIVTPIFAVRRLSKKRMKAPESDREEDVQDTDYVNWVMCDTNQSNERDQDEGLTTEIVYAAISFHSQRRSNTEQQKDSQNEDVIYSTVRRNSTCAANTET